MKQLVAQTAFDGTIGVYMLDLQTGRKFILRWTTEPRS
jgi:hypothetical protein